jgi:hypothetical protein
MASRNAKTRRPMYDIKFVPFVRPFRLAFLIGLVFVAGVWVGWPGVVLVGLASIDINLKG